MKGEIMNDFIQKNRGLLKFYHFVAKIIGWVLIGVTPVLLFITINDKTYRLHSNTDKTYILLASIRTFLVYYICLGLALLGVARFIRFLYSEESHPSLILRHFDKFLYLYALLMIAGLNVEFLYTRIFSVGSSSDEIKYLATRIVLTFAHVLIIIGLGYITHKIIPVIEESKTLV
jgi:hypothetical protein